MDADALYDLLKQPARIALVGASDDPTKYGNRILLVLTELGHTVLPVNPRATTISGLAAYPTLGDVPDPVDIVNVVVPPAVAMRVIEGADPARFPMLWFQPGSYDDDVVAAAEARFDAVVAGPCIMVVARSA